MEEFDSVKEALREVKILAKLLNNADKLYFVYEDYGKKCYVGSELNDVEILVNSFWPDGYSNNHVHHVNAFKIWEYSLLDDYPNQIGSRSLISSNNSLVRMKIKAIPFSCHTVR